MSEKGIGPEPLISPALLPKFQPGEYLLTWNHGAEYDAWCDTCQAKTPHHLIFEKPRFMENGRDTPVCLKCGTRGKTVVFK